MSLSYDAKLVADGVLERVQLAHVLATVGCDADGVLTTLHSYELLANTLSHDGDSIEFEYLGTFSGNAGAGLFFYMGSTGMFAADDIDPGNDTWVLRGRIVRHSATQLVGMSTLISAGLIKAKGTTDSSADPLSANTLALKGSGVTLNDVQVISGVLTRNVLVP